MTRVHRVLLVGVALACAVITTGCPVSKPVPLEGTSWQLVGDILGTPPPDEPTDAPGRPITATFERLSFGPRADVGSGRVTGSTGCNSYSATYDLNVDRLTIGAVTQTEIACDPNTMRREQAYLSRLQLTASFQIAGSTLRLRGADGAELLVFVAKPRPTTTTTAARPTSGPVGVWAVTGYLSDTTFRPIGTGEQVSLQLLRGGRLGGRACNIIGGTWAANGETIGLRAEFLTDMACVTPVAMDVEQWFLGDLAAATRWRVEGTTLTLTRADGTTVVTAIFLLPG